MTKQQIIKELEDRRKTLSQSRADDITKAHDADVKGWYGVADKYLACANESLHRISEIDMVLSMLRR